jgi:TonB-dependent receptor
MPSKTKGKKDRTSFLIAVLFHVVLILGVGYWAWKTGKLEEMAKRALEFVRTEKKETRKQEAKPIQQKAQVPPKLPPINQGLPQAASSSGTRRAVASDAPEAHGETFFADTRTQGAGPSFGAGRAGSAPATNLQAAPKAPPPRSAATRPVFDFGARTNTGSLAKLLQERASAASVQDSFGSEQMARSGTSSAADVVTKITGASVVEGKHAVIRGLADRYNITTLNGGEVPSADAYRRSVQVDVFNADTIEKIVTTKTFMPDQPGSATGGQIDIVTKSFPAKPFFNFSAETSYNDNSNLKDDFKVAPGSRIDLFGLGSQPKSLSPFLRSYPIGDQYPEVPQFMNSRRRETADEAQARRYQAELAEHFLQQLGTTGFAPHNESSPLNNKYNFSAGQTTYLFDRPFGAFFAGNWSKRFQVLDGVQGRYNTDLTTNRIMSDLRYGMDTDYGGTANLAYQFLPDHELNFNFLYNDNTVDETRILESTYIDPNSPMSGFDLLQYQNHYIQRELQVYQLRGRHLFETLGDTRLDWLASMSTTEQDEPDYRFYHVLLDANTNNNFASNQPQPDRPARYFRELTEDNLNLKADVTTPFRVAGNLMGQFKLGAYDSQANRDFFERTYLYRDDSRSQFRYVQGDPNGFLTSSNLTYDPVYAGQSTAGVGRTNYDFTRYVTTAPGGNNEYKGFQDVRACYVMGDMPLTGKLRTIGGVRFESTDLQMKGFNGISNVTTSIQQLDPLPAVGLVYTLSSNMSLRANYGGTLARPTFREVAPYKSYDAIGDELVTGNPDLKISSIQNYDLRWEWFPKPGEVVSVGAFYKFIKDPIERYSESREGGEYTFKNFQQAEVYGLEFEARKNLDFLDPNLSNFSLGMNFALIGSQVPLTKEEMENKGKYAEADRPLVDQSPYILNLDLTYEVKRSGTVATVLANLTGERLYIVNASTADVYEHPPITLDFVISQRIGRHLRLKLQVKNVLDEPFVRTMGRESDGPIYSSYTRGRTYALSLSAEF